MKLKLQISSDLHIGYPGARGFPPLVPGTDIVLIAGDTCEGLQRAIREMRAAYPQVEIVTCAGNHEFYHGAYFEQLAEGRACARELGVHFLEDGLASFGRLRILGCLEAELARHHAGTTIVMTHTGPTLDHVAPSDRSELISAAYASRLDDLIDRFQPDHWISGHVHYPVDFVRGRTRLISNPCGYAGEIAAFDPSFTIEVEA
ncbi:metallophosphoesterase [Bradyrhizobium sp. CB1717]|uniref:metallophosphoesterase n=1 Tax=Bradyrhizobium sp. CB1717 TaxID=3039154 RepID=UPI0024B13BDF|nr:metallophosphoesterase [Bradyrhizobium sp. CB1717]WFU23574.1 metallophosphoesterase [Bradyrhizobium sp. CB1717]